MLIRKLLVLLVVFSASCTENKRTRNNYFDSRKFFEEEVQRLRSAKRGVQKGLWFDGKEQFIEIKDTVNWEGELRPFTAIDLAADAFSGAFNVDTVSDGKHSIIQYLANDSKEEIKSIKLVYTQSRLTVVTFMLTGENSLYTSSKMLRYIPDSGYVISGEQQVNYLTKTNYQAGAKWID